MRNRLQRFDGARRTSGQIDDQAAMARPCDRSRQQSRWHFCRAFAAHLFTDARNKVLDYRLRRLGSIVARAKPSSASCQDKIDAILVREFAELLANIGRIIGDSKA